MNKFLIQKWCSKQYKAVEFGDRYRFEFREQLNTFSYLNSVFWKISGEFDE